MEPVNILVVDDDDSVSTTIEKCLRREKYSVTIANSGIQALQIARRRIPALILLDVIMPGMDGFAVCDALRADPVLADIPVIFLTARSKEEDRIQGFLSGGDDYLSKPFNLEELSLRIRAVLRRTGHTRETTDEVRAHSDEQQRSLPTAKKNSPPAEINIKGFKLNARTFEVVSPLGKRILLTPIQFDLLFHLMSHAGEIFSPARLLDEIWDYPTDAGSPDLVRVHIMNLRNRVEEDPTNPVLIETVPGFGYTVRKE